MQSTPTVWDTVPQSPLEPPPEKKVRMAEGVGDDPAPQTGNTGGSGSAGDVPVLTGADLLQDAAKGILTAAVTKQSVYAETPKRKPPAQRTEGTPPLA